MICAWEGCETPAKVRGYCRPHYNKAWREGIIETRRFRQHKGEPCAEDGCDAPAEAIRWCRSHYYRHEIRDRNLLAKYGISQADYMELLEKQGGVCAICLGVNATGKPLYVDHCHTTGKVRGLLCNTCNQGLGMFADDRARLLAAADYLAGDREYTAA